MSITEKENLKKRIDNATSVFFDAIDTLLFRKVNEPEIIYDLVGKHFGIHGFRKLRIDAEKKAESQGNVSLDEIYKILADEERISQDWNAIKLFEIQIEQDALAANEDIRDVFEYAVSMKKVCVVNNSFLPENLLSDKLKQFGYSGFETIVHAIQEDDNNLYIQKNDININTLDGAGTDLDKGLYKILYRGNKSFYYNLGVAVGGPLYMGLYMWLSERAKSTGKKIYFLSSTGNKLYEVFKKFEQSNIVLVDMNLKTFKDTKKAEEYLERVGLLSEDALIFDYNWQGDFQFELEKFKKKIGCTYRHTFYYVGIKNTEKSRKQMCGKHYDTFLFDFYKNHELQASTDQAEAIYDLFFLNEVREAADLLEGILAYMDAGYAFIQKYGVEYSAESSIGSMQRLIMAPNEEEAMELGSHMISDKSEGDSLDKKYIAYATKPQINQSEDIDIYWMPGFLKRTDIPEEFKKACAKKYGIPYPKVETEYHLEDDRNIRNYKRWMNYQQKHVDERVELTYKPKFSFVIPVYNTVTEQLRACIDSVLGQTYENFELILVDDHSSWDSVVPVLKSYEHNSKVRVIYRTENGHISAATNDGIRVADGDYIAFMDCDDVITPDALYEMAKKLNENPNLDFVYSDEDKMTEDGKICHMPFFKPDWSPDLYRCMNYTNHLSIYRTSIVKEIGGLRSAYNGSQDYDFSLRFLEKSDNKRVGHVQKILYHWRERKESAAFAISSKSYATEAARYAKEDYIRRNQIPAHIEYIPGMAQYRFIYDVVGNPLVSIIIPSKDHPKILQQCVDSIYRFTTYSNIEVIVVDNGSSEENKKIIGEILKKHGAKYIYKKDEFNFSKMCNTGAKNAKGEYVLFLNDDIEIIQPDWLERLLGHAQQEHIGAVGAKLLYPYTTMIQHAGVENIIDGPAHSFQGLDDHNVYYFGWNRIDYNSSAVTGACLLVQTNKYWEVGGFDESMPVAYNDVKLCFALHENGYYNVVRNDVCAYHHESLSRGNDIVDDAKLLRIGKERMRLYSDFPDLNEKDPYLNDNIRRLTDVLDLKVYFDELIPCDIKDTGRNGSMTIDSVADAGDRIYVVGWSFLPDEPIMEDLSRYLVCVDPYGKTYMAPVEAMLRQDVADSIGEGERYRYAGFECVLKKSQLRLDVIPYRLGMLTIGKDGKKILTWCENCEAGRQRNAKPRPMILNYNCLESFEKHDGSAYVQWNIDENSYQDGVYKLRGYAYRRGRQHYQYAKSLLLVNEAGEAYEFDLHLENRIDVAFAFPNEHFLYNTGFVCYVYENVLKKGQSYDVIIRLQNVFDENDILDITTGQKIVR